MKEKSEAWAATVKEGKLSQRNVWFMMENQFWPRIAFGIGVSMASFDTLYKCLMKPYYKIQSQGGVRNSIRRGIRQMHLRFYGVGCTHPAIECFIAQINKLLMHLGTTSMLGITMQASLDLLILELGMSNQPFLQDMTAAMNG
jgi:hypothetical protein